ncbi:hypothetical protein GCM10018779_53090 [Streptomyces griseocarneus]|nr:hypothetical protein GCM10018779_53090 [Streptomyces griseocarneus]
MALALPSIDDWEKSMADIMTTAELEALTGGDFEGLFADKPLIIADTEIRN